MKAKGPLVRLVDQGLFSLGNIAVVALVSHSATSAVAGSIIVLLVVYPVATALVQGYIVDFHLVFAGGGKPYPMARAWRGALIAGLPCALLVPILLLISDSGGGDSHAVTAAVVLFVTVPGLTAQYAGRAYCLATGRTTFALINDAGWIVGQALLYVIGRQVGLFSSDAAILSWCVAGSLCGLAFARGLRKTSAGPRPTKAVHKVRAQFAGELVLGQASAQINLVLLGALIGLAPLAGYRIAQVVLGPLITSLAAVRHVLLPRYAAIYRDKDARAVARQAYAHAILVAASLQLAAVVIWLLPASLGRSIFGDSWDEARRLVLLVGLDMAMAGAGLILAICLRGMRVATGGLVVRVLISGVGVFAVLIACVAFDSPTAVAWAGALASLVGVVLYLSLIRAAAPRRSETDSRRPAHGRHRAVSRVDRAAASLKQETTLELTSVD